MVSLRLELGIDTQRFTQQVQTYNAEVEKQIQTGVEQAMDELCKEQTLIELVKDQVKRQALNSVTNYMFKYDLQKAINERVQNILTKKVDEFATKLTDEMAKQLGLEVIK